jgi:pimeloyl-ACP methyl ester carboxylesterase
MASDVGQGRDPVEVQHLRMHGHDVAYRTAGSGPVVVLVHGIASSSETWGRVLPALAERVTVVAPDLLGHGSSTKHAGDYSLGALAAGIRDLLIALGHERATLIGHSLGGGVALQFAYQFPHRCERLVLVGSGGLGKEVALHIRALSFPGAEFLLRPAFIPRVQTAGLAAMGWLRSIGLRPAPSFEEFWRGYGSLMDGQARQAFFRTLHAVVDPGGQRVSALDRLYLASGRPTLIVWGERDQIIPVRHARIAHEAMPGSQLCVLEGVGHFPQHEEPERFVRVVLDFVGSTRPARLSESQLAELLSDSDGAADPHVVGLQG